MMNTVLDVIWLLLAGLWLAIGHVLSGIALCVTIVGIPLGIGSSKMEPLPLGREIVDGGPRRR